jgi:hypothetical protein
MNGSSEQHRALVDGIVQFSEAAQQHVEELCVPRDKLPALLVDAIGKLKARPELEELDEKLRAADAELEGTFELHETKGAKSESPSRVVWFQKRGYIISIVTV